MKGIAEPAMHADRARGWLIDKLNQSPRARGLMRNIWRFARTVLAEVKMSVTARLEDAKLLYDHGRHEGALLSVLVAAAGTSRRRFPRGTQSRRNPKTKMGDGEAFETFVAEEMQRVGTCAVYFNGQCNSAEKVFYKWLRCSLAHEAELPNEIVFCAGEHNNVAGLCWEAGPPERLIVTHPVVLLIGHVVATAPENAGVPETVRQLMVPSGP